MDFNFTAEQEMLRDSVARYFGDHYAFPQRQAVLRSQEGWRAGFWRGLAGGHRVHQGLEVAAGRPAAPVPRRRHVAES